MSEFARYLVAGGVTSSRFARITRLAFFRAASESAKFTNSRVNRSAVAAMTGLTRVQVREFTKAEKSTSESRPDYIERVIRAWNTDASFITSNHTPRRLSTGGKGSTFGKLVAKYGGDIPARSILREMTRNELVVVKGRSVCLKRKARQTNGQTQLQHLSQLLAQLLSRPKALSRNTLSLRSIVSGVAYPSSSAKGRLLTQRKSAEGLTAFLAELQAAGIAASIETPATGKQKSRLTRTRVMVITEELGWRINASNSKNKGARP